MSTFALAVVGRDQPGIIAAITKVFYELDCNLADTNMSVLNGNFAMVMMVQAPDAMSEQRLRHELSLVTQRFDLLISVAEANVVAFPQGASGGERAMVTVYGADMPGIVAGVTSAIAATGSNVVDLRTQQTGAPNSMYSLFMEVELARDTNRDLLERALAPLANEFSVEVAIQNLAAAAEL